HQEVMLCWDFGHKRILPVWLTPPCPIPARFQYPLAARHYVVVADRPEAEWAPEVLAALAAHGAFVPGTIATPPPPPAGGPATAPRARGAGGVGGGGAGAPGAAPPPPPPAPRRPPPTAPPRAAPPVELPLIDSREVAKREQSACAGHLGLDVSWVSPTTNMRF